MLEWIDEIGLMYVIYFSFTAIIYLLGRMFSNVPLLRYSETLVKEGILLAILIGVSYLFYFMLYEYDAPPGFYDDLFGSSTGYSGTIYEVAKTHLTNITKLAQMALYYYTELEGRILYFSAFQCSGCPTGLGFDCFGNIGMVKAVYAYKKYIEPLQQTVVGAKMMMEQTVRILFTFWILVDLARSPVFMALIPIAVIIRLLPGMKFVGNILFSLMLAFVVVLPLLAVLQAYIFFPSTQKLYDIYTTKLSESQLPDYFKLTTLEGFVGLFAGGCTMVTDPPSIYYKDGELVLSITNSIFKQKYEVTDRELKEAAQELFLISVFNLSAGVVGMIAFVKGVSDLLGERNSFIDLFLRII